MLSNFRISLCGQAKREARQGKRLGNFSLMFGHSLIYMRISPKNRVEKVHMAMLKSLTYVTLIASIALQCHAGVVCNKGHYGAPDVYDCTLAISAMPDGEHIDNPTPRILAFRNFVEPQFLDPPFTRVQNDLNDTMVQLPKVFRYSQPFTNRSISQMCTSLRP